MKKMLFVAAALMLIACTAFADVPDLRGFVKGEGYQYAVFGTYPCEEDGASAPVLWRVLGPGTPEDDDLNNAANDIGFKKEKYCTGDDLTGENADVFCLMTEYIIDVALYHEVADTQEGPALDYADTQIREHLNTKVIERLFTEAERAALLEMPQRGLLSVPSRKGELFRPDYGFKTEDFGATPRRATQGTPYAYAQGLKLIKGNSWYWTTDWRAPGRRWIVGDNGHISVSGLVRVGGIRPVIYVHSGMLQCTGGEGTKENPFVLTVLSEDAKE